MGTHKQLQGAERDTAKALAEALDEVLNPEIKKTGIRRVGFVLLTALFGDIKEGRVNYTSNGQRADMLDMMKEYLARVEGRHPEENPSKKLLRFEYKNYKGEVAIRTVIPIKMMHGATDYHPEEQYLLHAYDVEKQSDRFFAVKDILRFIEVEPT